MKTAANTSKQMTNLIEKYLAAHTLAWAPSTLKSERARLMAVADLIASGPQALYGAKEQALGSYSLRTLFVRLADLERWSKRKWGYQAFMTENTRLFKHAYKKESLDVSKDQLTANLCSIRPDYLRTLAEGLFRNGLRISELQNYDKSAGLVVGKGGRGRRLLAPEALPDRHPSNCELGQLRRELTRVGLKPHSLRKAAATLLARANMQPTDLMHVMGWSNLQTAVSYLQPQQDNVLKQFANNVLGGN